MPIALRTAKRNQIMTMDLGNKEANREMDSRGMHGRNLAQRLLWFDKRLTLIVLVGDRPYRGNTCCFLICLDASICLRSSSSNLSGMLLLRGPQA